MSFELIFESNFNHVVMKCFLLYSLMTMCLIINSLAQQPKQKSNSPKENSTVKREYDENGNLIRFDSTYTYSWSGDTIFMKSISPENMPDLFDNQFGFFRDSTFTGHSFFDEFDRFFELPFSGLRDLVWMKRFGIQPQFHHFHSQGDSLAMNHGFDHFFEFFNNNPNDSVFSNELKKGLRTPHRQSMDEMMKLFREQMKTLQEQHRNFFEDQPNWMEF